MSYSEDELHEEEEAPADEEAMYRPVQQHEVFYMHKDNSLPAFCALPVVCRENSLSWCKTSHTKTWLLSVLYSCQVVHLKLKCFSILLPKKRNFQLLFCFRPGSKEAQHMSFFLG